MQARCAASALGHLLPGQRPVPWHVQHELIHTWVDVSAVYFLAVVIVINARDFVFSLADESAEAIAQSLAAMPKVCVLAKRQRC